MADRISYIVCLFPGDRRRSVRPPLGLSLAKSSALPHVMLLTSGRLDVPWSTPPDREADALSAASKALNLSLALGSGLTARSGGASAEVPAVSAASAPGGFLLEKAVAAALRLVPEMGTVVEAVASTAGRGLDLEVGGEANREAGTWRAALFPGWGVDLGPVVGVAVLGPA